MTPPPPPPPPSPSPVRLTYGEHPRQFVDVFSPVIGEGEGEGEGESQTQGKLPPLFVFIHGGAWRTGDVAEHYPLAAHLAARGVACALVEYRLTLVPHVPTAATQASSTTASAQTFENQHPAHILDVHAALALLARSSQGTPAASWDPARLILSGHSIGAWLAASVLLDARASLPPLPDAAAAAAAAAGPLPDLRAVRAHTSAYVLLDGIYDVAALLREYAAVDAYRQFVEQAFVRGGEPVLNGAEDQRIARGKWSATDWPVWAGEGSDAEYSVVIAHSQQDELLTPAQSRRAAAYLRSVLPAGRARIACDEQSLTGSHDGMLQTPAFYKWVERIVAAAAA